MSLNKVMLIGHLGSDPTFKKINEYDLCTFSIATSENWVDKTGQKQQSTEWHNVEVWGKLALLCNEYLQKGSLVYIEGALKTTKSESEKGVRYFTNVNAKKVNFLSKTKQHTNGQDMKTSKQVNEMASEFTADDIPF
jgi:single-strand DNA-binding protein